jgi:hypothetical protein
MGLKELAEGIILQSIEDLYNADERQDCVTFSGSNNFIICAEMAEMDTASQVRLLDLVRCMIAASAGTAASPPELRCNRSLTIQVSSSTSND